MCLQAVRSESMLPLQGTALSDHVEPLTQPVGIPSSGLSAAMAEMYCRRCALLAALVSLAPSGADLS